jgi:hypothetical protein
MTESLADPVVCGAQPRVIAHIVEQPGRFVMENRESGAQLQ